MNGLALWLVPPAVGAVIGYVTNAIAIKMLFRPLRERRVFGVRVPFTPGILPRERSALAESIGRMVARELLTEEIVRERISAEDFRAAVGEAVSSYTGTFLATPLSRLVPAPALPPPDADEAAALAAVPDLGSAVSAVLARFLRSSSFADIVSTLAAAGAESLAAKTPAQLLGPDLEERLAASCDRLCGALSSEETRNALAAAAERAIAGLSDRGATLGELLGNGAEDTVAALVRALYPTLSESLLHFLNTKETRADLESRGRLFVRDVIMELNTLQRLFLSAGQYDRTIDARMPAIISDLIDRIDDFIHEAGTIDRLSSAAGTAVRRLLDMELSRAAEAAHIDLAAMTRAGVLRLLDALLGGKAGGMSLSALLVDFVGKTKDEPLSSILQRVLGISIGNLAAGLASVVVQMVQGTSGTSIGSAIPSFLRSKGDMTVSEFLGVDEAEKRRLDAALSEKLIQVVDEKVPSMLATLDVKKIVKDRIDALDMEDVERIVLDVMADQFKWINVFGAILGAIIGVFQVVLGNLLR